MAETKRNGELKVHVGPVLIAEVDQYATTLGVPMDIAVYHLLQAGLSKLTPRSSGANGKRKAKGAGA
jgi:hypothetical protein